MNNNTSQHSGINLRRKILPLHEWEELSGPDWNEIRKAICKDSTAESEKWNLAAAQRDDQESPFMRRRAQLQEKSQPSPCAPSSARQSLPAGARKLPPSPRTPGSRGSMVVMTAPRQGFYMQQPREISTRLTAGSASSSYFAPPKFAQPSFGREVQSAASTHLRPGTAQLIDVPATAHHQKRLRPTQDSACWPTLPPHCSQHIKAQPGSTDPNQASAPALRW